MNKSMHFTLPIIKAGHFTLSFSGNYCIVSYHYRRRRPLRRRRRRRHCHRYHAVRYRFYILRVYKVHFLYFHVL